MTRISYRRYMQEQLTLSRWALKNQDRLDAKFYTHTFTAELSKLDYFDQSIKKFLEDKSKMSNAQKPEKVMTINIQFFPLPKMGEV